MANTRLTVQPLSRNDITTLANLFEISFDYHINHNSPFFTDYLRSLRIVAGLGFAAALSDRALLCNYQNYLNNFMRYNEGNFKERQEAKTSISQSTAEMVATSIISFNALNHPRYYDDFIVALHYTIARIPELRGQQNEAERILSGLTVNKW